MRKLIAFFIVMLGCSIASAELVAQKNVAYTAEFHLWKNDGTVLTSVAGLDSEFSYRDAGGSWSSFTDCANEAVEDGTTGDLRLVIAQAEMNHEWVRIKVKSSSSGAVTRFITLRTTTSNPQLMATTDDGGTINVTTGKVDEVTALTGHTAQTGDSYAIVNNGTYGNSALNTAIGTRSSHSAADVAALVLVTPAQKLVTDASGRVTVGSNADKTGYALSAAGIDSIWDETQAGHAEVGSFGVYLDAKVSEVGGGTAADIADAVWDELLSGHDTEDSAGLKLYNLPESGTGDWTVNEKAELKTILGVTNTGTPDDTPSDGSIKYIQDSQTWH